MQQQARWEQVAVRTVGNEGAYGKGTEAISTATTTKSLDKLLWAAYLANVQMFHSVNALASQHTPTIQLGQLYSILAESFYISLSLFLHHSNS